MWRRFPSRSAEAHRRAGDSAATRISRRDGAGTPMLARIRARAGRTSASPAPERRGIATLTTLAPCPGGTGRARGGRRRRRRGVGACHQAPTGPSLGSRAACPGSGFGPECAMSGVGGSRLSLGATPSPSQGGAAARFCTRPSPPRPRPSLPPSSHPPALLRDPLPCPLTLSRSLSSPPSFPSSPSPPLRPYPAYPSFPPP